MNQDLAQILTNIDARINSLRVDPLRVNDSQVDEIRKLRTQMESKVESYNSVIAKANEDVRKDLEDLARQVEQRISYLMQPQHN